MKKNKIFMLTSLLLILVFTSCVQDKENDISLVEDTMQERTAPPPQPDLIVTSITSNLPITAGPCPAGTLPNGTGGVGLPNTISMTIVVTNVGDAPVPVGNFCLDVDWIFPNGSAQSILYSVSGGIPINGTATFTSPGYALPVPATPPVVLLIAEDYGAEINQAGCIVESDISNNISPRHTVCHNL